MAGCRIQNTKEICLLVLLLFVVYSYGLNVGLIASDLKRTGSPMYVKKVSRNAPVFIQIKSEAPSHLKQLFSKLSKPGKPTKPPVLKKLARSIAIPRLPIPPLLSLFPRVLPIFPPLFPTTILPLAILPPRSVLPPVRLTSKKIERLHSLDNNNNPILSKRTMTKKLFALVKEGSLTTSEFLRFKRLLLK